MKANPKMWCLSKYTAQINFRKVTQRELTTPQGSFYEGRATYHDTWENAHAALVDRALNNIFLEEANLKRQERAVEASHKAYRKAQGMTAPGKGAAGTPKPNKNEPEPSP